MGILPGRRTKMNSRKRIVEINVRERLLVLGWTVSNRDHSSCGHTDFSQHRKVKGVV